MQKPNLASTQALAEVERLIAKQRSPGAQYLFASPHAVLAESNIGVANLATGRAVTSRTTFNAFSVTKTITAAAILQLAEQGQLDLDAPVSKYVDLPPNPAGPTIRQTLTHRGGFANPNPLPWVHLAAEHTRFDPARFVHDTLQQHGRPKRRPGERVAYSNVGYLLLGEVIARVSGQAYVEYVQQRLIQPLQLPESETLAFKINQAQLRAHGTLVRRSLLNLVFGWFVDRSRFTASQHGQWLQLRHLQLNGDAYGGLIANARGLAHYALSLLAGDTLVSAASRDLLFGPARDAEGQSLGHSLGWFIGHLDGEPYAAHAGGGIGYYSELRAYPRLARASVLMLNGTGVKDVRLLDRIDGRLLAQNLTASGSAR